MGRAKGKRQDLHLDEPVSVERTHTVHLGRPHMLTEVAERGKNDPEDTTLTKGLHPRVLVPSMTLKPRGKA